jgi:hypothetical protein
LFTSLMWGLRLFLVWRWVKTPPSGMNDLSSTVFYIFSHKKNIDANSKGTVTKNVSIYFLTLGTESMIIVIPTLIILIIPSNALHTGGIACVGGVLFPSGIVRGGPLTIRGQTRGSGPSGEPTPDFFLNRK